MIVTIPATGILFDCDGVLVASIEPASVAWDLWAARYAPSYDFRSQMEHGRRAADVIATLVSSDVFEEAVCALEAWELETATITEPIPGAVTLTSSLPPDRWAVVTSAMPNLARARMAAAGHSAPSVLVTAADVKQGKPAPEPYLTGARRLGLRPQECVVFEDAPAGVRSARAAGVGWVVGVGDHLRGVEVDAYVEDLRSVSFLDGMLVLSNEFCSET